MSMKINCDKCGYILGGIEVKENYGCKACNPFWKESCGDCGHINGFHLDKCPRSTAILGNNPVCPDCLPYDRCEKHASSKVLFEQDKLNPPMPKAPSRPPLPIKYCGICGRILIQTPIGTYYDNDTAEQYNHWRFTCPEYRWWKIWDRYHTNFRCNEDGSTYAYES